MKNRFIYVFGSNLEGIHGSGSALKAIRDHGAVFGQGVGLQGDSYAIPTKRTPRVSLPLASIEEHVKEFLLFARENPNWNFYIVPIGCGLAGYKVEDIAPMFGIAPMNCILPLEFDKFFYEINGRVAE